MIRNPILRVPYSIRTKRVRALMMRGQACVLYDAGEFSRDADFVPLPDPENLSRFRLLVEELDAEVIDLPPREAR